MHRLIDHAFRQAGFSRGRFGPPLVIAAAIALALALPAAASAAQTLSVTKNGTGTGTVTSSPAGINCGATCSASFDEGSTVTLTGSAGANTQLVQWSGCSSVNGENKCLVTMSAAKSVTATFKLNQRQLSVTKNGTGTGTVTSSPAGINCGATCSASFDEGSTVTLTGSPGANTQPVQWSGCAGVNGENKCLVTMSAAKSVTATFDLAQRQLTVTKAGSGSGTVTGSPAGIACGATCAAGFDQGSTVTLTGAPGLHSEAVKWTGCSSVNGENKCLVTMSAAKSVTATFDLDPGYVLYTVTVARIGTGTGTVNSSPGSIECGPVCSDEILTKTKLTLTATPLEGSVFDHWSGGGCSGTGPCEATINSSRLVKAVFTAVGTRTLTVSKAGTGTGAVTSKPAGIDCGASCSARLDASTKVTLTATPAPGSTFTGFSGACSGTAACKVTMNEARSLTAAFEKAPAPGPPSSGTLVVSGTAKVKGGKALVEILCHGPSVCHGSLSLLAKLGKDKSVKIGGAGFNLAPGASTKLKVKLSPGAKQRLSSAGRLKARVTGAGIRPHAVRLKPQAG